MSTLLRYECGCTYYHGNDNSVSLCHGCPDHRAELAQDALRNFSKRVKLGTSG